MFSNNLQFYVHIIFKLKDAVHQFFVFRFKSALKNAPNKFIFLDFSRMLEITQKSNMDLDQILLKVSNIKKKYVYINTIISIVFLVVHKVQIEIVFIYTEVETSLKMASYE